MVDFPPITGLLLGFIFVLIGQIIVLIYYWFRRSFLHSRNFIQVTQPPSTTLYSDLKSHITAPESFLLVFGYLSFVWIFKLLPSSYYDLNGNIVWFHVFLQFITVDALIYGMHRVEHAWPRLYKASHKAHHVWINPRLYNAFNGSVPDTVSLILIPLFFTHQICWFVNNWTFIAFGTLYAAQFTLIHCEFPHPWDPLLDFLKIGTAENHNVHHAMFTYNYGHFFMWFDILFGTYKNGRECRKMRSSEGVVSTEDNS